MSKTTSVKRPISNSKTKNSGVVTEAADWCVLIFTANTILLVSEYKASVVEFLKQAIPAGARRYHRAAQPAFLSQFNLNSTQVGWLKTAKYFSNLWEILPDYRQMLLNQLAKEFNEIWLVENGHSYPYQLPAGPTQPEIALAETVVMPLIWAKNYALYCHKHGGWETETPCREAGLILDKVVTPAKKWPDRELHAARNTLVRATREQISYYLAAPGEPVRLGRDAEGEKAAIQIAAAQRLVLLLKVARLMSETGSPEDLSEVEA